MGNIREMLKALASKTDLSDQAIRKVYDFTYGKYDQRKRARSVASNFWVILEEISNAAERSNVHIWPEFGTLLGLHREGRPISSDPDIDFGAWFSEKDIIKRSLLNAAFKLEKVYECQLHNSKILEEVYSFRGVQLDVFYFHQSENIAYTHDFLRSSTSKYSATDKSLSGLTVRTIEFPEFTLVPHKVNNVRTNFPSDISTHLSARYGTNYMTPDSKWTARTTSDKVISHSGIMKYI